LKKTILFLTFISVLYFNRIILYKNLFILHDLNFQHYPYHVFLSENLKRGIFPLWNPYNFNGEPFFANPHSAIFSPFSIIFNIFSFKTSLKIFYPLVFFLAGLFMFLLLQKFKISRISSLIGTVIFMFNGFFASRIELISELRTEIWFPLIFLFFKSYLKEKNNFMRYLFFLSLCFCFSFFGGYPRILFYIGFFLFLYGLLNLKEEGLKPILLVIFSSILAVVISSVQMMPSLELAKNTFYFAKTAVMNTSLPLKRLISFIFPYFFDYRAGQGLYIFTFYTGIISVIFTLISFLNKKIIKLNFLLILSIFLSFGKYTPVFPFFDKYIFLKSKIFWPAIFLFWSVFLISIITSLTAEKIFKKRYWMKLIVLMLLIFDLFSFGWNKKLNPVINDKYFDFLKRENTKYIEIDRYFRIFFTPKILYEAEFSGKSMLEIYFKIKETMLPNLNMLYHIRSFNGYNPLMYKKTFEILRKIKMLGFEKSKKIIELSGCKYIISAGELQGKEIVSIFKSESIYIYKNLNYKKRIRILKNGTVKLLKETPDFIKIDIYSKDENTLILADTFYPGWKVFVNGKPDRIHLYSDLFKKVYIKKGKSSIIFLFMPNSFIIGLFLTFLSNFLLLVLLSRKKFLQRN